MQQWITEELIWPLPWSRTGLPRWFSGKESACQCRRCKRWEFDPWVGKTPGVGNGKHTPVILPGEFLGQRSLAGYSPWGRRIRHDWAAAAAAKSLQSCLTLCDPIDSSPPGSPVPGILQARTLEWVAISFSNARKWKVKVKSLNRVLLLVTPCSAAYQAPLSMGFSRQKSTGVGCHCLLWHDWACMRKLPRTISRVGEIKSGLSNCLGSFCKFSLVCLKKKNHYISVFRLGLPKRHLIPMCIAWSLS